MKIEALLKHLIDRCESTLKIRGENVEARMQVVLELYLKQATDELKRMREDEL